MVKTLENLLQNQESFGAESWCIALRTQALPSSNDDHRLTVDLFTARSNLRLCRFVWREKLKFFFFFFFNVYLRLMAETYNV